MSSLKNLEDLFEHQLKDIYSAEKQIKSGIPKMIKNTDNKKLKEAFNHHLKQTETQLERLTNIARDLEINITGETCKGMKGLINEAEDFLSEDAESDVRDAGLIANAQRVEHYEISAYSTVVEYAKALGHREPARLLEETLKEERKTDEKLNDLAIDIINVKARV